MKLNYKNKNLNKKKLIKFKNKLFKIRMNKLIKWNLNLI